MVGRYHHGNQLSGWMPTELGNLTKLASLYTSHFLSVLLRGFCAPLYWLLAVGVSDEGVGCGGGSDSAVCPPAGVVGRELSGNQLSGSIPVELGRLTALTELYESLLFLCVE